jgi:hypothetical protein
MSISALRDVTRLIRREGGKFWKIPFFKRQTEGKADEMLRFFEAIAEDKVHSKEDAEKLVFNTAVSDAQFRTFKHRFKDRLIDSLFLLEVDKPELSLAYKADYRCNRLIQASKVLMASGAGHAAINLLHQALKIATKFDLTEEQVFLNNQLRRHYSLVGNKKIANQYRQAFWKSLEGYEAEIKSEEMWYQLFVEYATSVSFKPELGKLAGDFVKKSTKLLKKYPSYQIRLNDYRIRDMNYQINHRFHKGLESAKKAREFCDDNPRLATPFVKGEWALKQLNCCLHLQDYEQGKVYAEDCKQYFPPTSTNRLIFFEFYFLLAMHTGRYKTALAVYREATGHDRFRYLPESRREKWKIFEAYLHYVFETDKKDSDQKGYNVYRLFNEVPVFRKDKKGYNIAILIVQTLFYLKREFYSMIITRAEALKMYSYRYLSSDLTPRSQYLIEMLLKMEACEFDYENTVKATEEHYKKLKSHQHNYVGRIENMEVIPYETIWEWVLDKLRNRNVRA